MDFFNYSDSSYTSALPSLSTAQLQKREVHYTRAIQAHATGVGLGASTTVLTGGLAFPVPLISARFLDIAWDKLKRIQFELIDRFVQLHVTTATDLFIGVGAASAAYAACMPLDDVVTGVAGGSEWTFVAAEVIKALPGELVVGAMLKVSDKKPPRGCPRRKMYDNLRLKCKICERGFDTSYTEFLHCCSCDDDNHDICARCVPLIKHSPQHTLHKISPKCPRIRTCWRAKLGYNPSCKGCDRRLQSEDYYSCPECLPKYDVCIGCYEAGRWCGKHREPLKRGQVKG